MLPLLFFLILKGSRSRGVDPVSQGRGALHVVIILRFLLPLPSTVVCPREVVLSCPGGGRDVIQILLYLWLTAGMAVVSTAGVKTMVASTAVSTVTTGMVVMPVGVVTGVGTRARARGPATVRRGRVVRNSPGWVEVEAFGATAEKSKGREGGLGTYAFVTRASIGR